MGTDLHDGHHRVLRLTQEAYQALESYAKANPEQYLDPETDFAAILTSMGIADYAEDTGITSAGPIDLKPPGQGPGHRADRQAIEFYSNFRGMTPRECHRRIDVGVDDPLQASRVHVGSLAPAAQHQPARVHRRPLVRGQPRKRSVEQQRRVADLVDRTHRPESCRSIGRGFHRTGSTEPFCDLRGASTTS